MNSSNKMNNVLLVLLSASVIATFGTIIFHLVDTSYETETAMRAKADESKFFEGVYVRDETVLTYSDTGAISYQVPDGGKIAVNDVIAEIYPDESTIEKTGRGITGKAECFGTYLQSRNAGTGTACGFIPPDFSVLRRDDSESKRWKSLRHGSRRTTVYGILQHISDRCQQGNRFFCTANF